MHRLSLCVTAGAAVMWCCEGGEKKPTKGAGGQENTPKKVQGAGPEVDNAKVQRTVLEAAAATEQVRRPATTAMISSQRPGKWPDSTRTSRPDRTRTSRPDRTWTSRPDRTR